MIHHYKMALFRTLCWARMNFRALQRDFDEHYCLESWVGGAGHIISSANSLGVVEFWEEQGCWVLTEGNNKDALVADRLFF